MARASTARSPSRMPRASAATSRGGDLERIAMEVVQRICRGSEIREALWFLACIADDPLDEPLQRLQIVSCDLPHDLGVYLMIRVTQAIAEVSDLLPRDVWFPSLDICWNVSGCLAHDFEEALYRQTQQKIRAEVFVSDSRERDFDFANRVKDVTDPICEG